MLIQQLEAAADVCTLGYIIISHTISPSHHLKYEKHEILPLALVALYQPVGRDIPILLVAFVNAVTKSTKRLGNTLGKIMTSKIQKAYWSDQINTNQLRSVLYCICHIESQNTERNYF